MRRVAWVLLFYALGAWAVFRAAAVVRRVLGLPELFQTLLGALLAIGVPVAIAVAWRFPHVGGARRRTATGSVDEPSSLDPGGER